MFRYISLFKLNNRYCQTTNCKEMSLFWFDWLHLSKQQTIYSCANTKHNAGFKIAKLFAWLTHLTSNKRWNWQKEQIYWWKSFQIHVIECLRVFSTVHAVRCVHVNYPSFPRACFELFTTFLTKQINICILNDRIWKNQSTRNLETKQKYRT